MATSSPARPALNTSWATSGGLQVGEVCMGPVRGPGRPVHPVVRKASRGRRGAGEVLGAGRRDVGMGVEVELPGADAVLADAGAGVAERVAPPTRLGPGD